MHYVIQRSNRRDKKYQAVFDNGKIIHFGGIKRNGEPYEQFRDSTPIKAFSAYDHNDPERKKRYYARHGTLTNAPIYSASWFSGHFLWT